jgi:predicted dehydrogenase
MLHTWVDPGEGNEAFPLRLEMKRMAPGETNTWFFEVLGTEGGVRFSTKRPKTLETFAREEDQVWKHTDLGFGTQFKTVTGGIFEAGFPDVIQQMWAAYLVEREGLSEGRFGCVTVEEAVASQEIFDAALRSQNQQTVVNV